MHERLKTLRKTLDLTQQGFADRIGIKRNTIATYESGRNEPIDAVVALICREFHVNENWLRNGTGEMFLEQSTDEQIAAFIGNIQASEGDSFQKRVLSMLSKLEKPEWELLEKMILLLKQDTTGN